jgi:hypothetical protein
MRQLVFHSALFTAQPAVIKPDDASRRLDNPRQFCDRDSRSRDLIRGRDEPLAQGGARPVVKQGRPCAPRPPQVDAVQRRCQCQDRLQQSSTGHRPRRHSLRIGRASALPADLAARNRRSGEARPDMPARNHLKLNSFLALVYQEPGHAVRRLLSTRDPSTGPTPPLMGGHEEPRTTAHNGAGDQPV